ncbi:MAG: VWA domain-containing protein [Thiofilum sp.]|uniref:vWA domain-containing protein n=1 Tax=Thiofilum sp. TaxID=2212733 RepID=UPI0025FC43A8|nr:VWA domain-containing protein [Thiofilum sp.]MBK8453932.1 VWA domain-containing protein [Thiofilum sp.]
MRLPFNGLLKISTLVFSAIILSGCLAGDTIDTKDKAEAKIKELVDGTIQPSYNENQSRANIQLTRTNLSSLLPDLNEYPITLDVQDSPRVEAAEILTSPEKAGNNRDALYLEMAQRFNQQGLTISNGKQAAIAIRKMDSGLGAQFILTGQYVPDAFSPSNALWGAMVNANGNNLTTIAPVTAPNVAGIVVKKAKADQITTEGKLDIAKLLTNVSNGSFAMGYTNPYQSSTGLNFLLTVLNSFANGDETQMLSPDVASAFEAFQQGVPFVAQNTLQMREAAQGSGVLDAFVMEYQLWANATGLEDYQFVPFGVRHDGPLYATNEADPAEREVLALFAKFLASQKGELSRFGFDQVKDYKDAYAIKDGSIIAQAQRLWKQKKSGGKPIAAVFVADISGSMEGTRIKNLRKALVESSDLISTNNAIGLVTYSDTVNVDLPIRPFNVSQKSLFIGAVEKMATGGKTATNSAVLVAANMLTEFKKQNPDYKTVIFVLSDGETNLGVDFETAKNLMSLTAIPIHTIAYELSSQELKEYAGLAEGAYIESSAGAASYRIGNLLNAEM